MRGEERGRPALHMRRDCQCIHIPVSAHSPRLQLRSLWKPFPRLCNVPEWKENSKERQKKSNAHHQDRTQGLEEKRYKDVTRTRLQGVMFQNQMFDICLMLCMVHGWQGHLIDDIRQICAKRTVCVSYFPLLKILCRINKHWLIFQTFSHNIIYGVSLGAGFEHPTTDTQLQVPLCTFSLRAK